MRRVFGALLISLSLTAGGASLAAPAMAHHGSGNHTVTTIENAPGHDDAGPGNSENAPGHDEAGPGNSENAPGHDEAGPGNSENAPGHDDAGPGNSENAPGHDEAGPGNSENAPGHDEAGPGNSENAPGHDEAGPGKSENAPGRGDGVSGEPDGNAAIDSNSGSEDPTEPTVDGVPAAIVVAQVQWDIANTAAAVEPVLPVTTIAPVASQHVDVSRHLGVDLRSTLLGQTVARWSPTMTTPDSIVGSSPERLVPLVQLGLSRALETSTLPLAGLGLASGGWLAVGLEPSRRLRFIGEMLRLLS